MITTIPNTTNSFTLRISGLDITYPNIKSPTSASYQFITNVALGASTIWTNSNPIYTNLSSITISITGLNNNVPPPIIAAGQSVALTVNLKYKNASGTKRVVIHFSTPGCESKTQTAQ